MVNAFVKYDSYDYDQSTGAIAIQEWKDGAIVVRPPIDDAERLAALEQIVLELHARLERIAR